MAQIGPLTITARNEHQAAYLVRSRAEQRGLTVSKVEVADAGAGAWFVTVTVSDDDLARVEAAQLDEDTQVMHFHTHPRRGPETD